MTSDKHRDQARLRLVKTENFDLCSSYSFNAASPLGSAVRSHSISLMADGDSPTSRPMAARVMPVPRRSETREDHVVDVAMRSSLRLAVDHSQRLPVTEFRENYGMPKPVDMPGNLKKIGQRVRWWRDYRKISRRDLAKKVGYSYSGLSDLELGESTASEKLHLIAAELGLNPHYLETGDGEPEAGFPQEPPPPADDWPFPAISKSRFRRLNRIERSYAETKLLEALAEIEAERRSKAG